MDLAELQGVASDLVPKPRSSRLSRAEASDGCLRLGVMLLNRVSHYFDEEEAWYQHASFEQR